METEIRDYYTYFEMGRYAFLNGVPCAPCNDKVYMDGYSHQWKGAKVDDVRSKEANEAAKAWLHGWTVENLKMEEGTL